MAVFWNRLGYTPIHIEEAQGHSGGIWVLSAWPGVSCNVVAASSQVVGTVSRRAERFGALLDECGLIDLGAHGSLYTWFRHMQGNRFISKRLDRAVATDAWCFRFPESYVENLARMHSDHCPIMIRCQGNDRRVGVELDVMEDQELPSLSREAIESFTRNVSKEEVRKVVMGMNSFKAPVRARVEFLDICEAALTIEDVYRDGVWHLERIYSFIPMDLREDILSLVHISASSRDLGWSWEHTLYSAKQGYLWLIQNKLNWDRNINWLWLWKARVPEKLRLLVWLCLHDAVPTQYLRFRRHLSSSSLCTRCNQLPETILHCFRDCEVVRSVWVSLDFSDVCFFGSHEGLKSLSWSPPEPGAWKLNCDGSVNLGDDCAGFGWVIRDSSSQWVMGCSGNSFGSSVIKMELWSIWKGLAWAWEAGLKLVVCETDCASTFELVTSWQVPLWHLEKEVIQLIFDLKLRMDWDIRFELISREANVVADRLAKMESGGSGADEVHLWYQPPEVVCPLLLLRT
ncbi:hypothetical protein AHAS_Ahas20G0134200 [Arachis hypogaea]